MLEELFCRVLREKVSIIVGRNDQAINESLAMKTVTCIGLKNPEISHKLSKLSTKCSVDIPWLVEKKWIPLWSIYRDFTVVYIKSTNNNSKLKF